MIKGEITTTFFETTYEDGSFLIDTPEGFYIDSSVDLELVKQRFHVDLKEGDRVYVICKISPHEISPQKIDIYDLFKR